MTQSGHACNKTEIRHNALTKGFCSLSFDRSHGRLLRFDGEQVSQVDLWVDVVGDFAFAEETREVSLHFGAA